jgi:hypothetical protein
MYGELMPSTKEWLEKRLQATVNLPPEKKDLFKLESIQARNTVDNCVLHQKLCGVIMTSHYIVQYSNRIADVYKVEAGSEGIFAASLQVVRVVHPYQR